MPLSLPSGYCHQIRGIPSKTVVKERFTTSQVRPKCLIPADGVLQPAIKACDGRLRNAAVTGHWARRLNPTECPEYNLPGPFKQDVPQLQRAPGMETQ